MQHCSIIFGRVKTLELEVIMKTIKLLAILTAFSFVLVACSNDKDTVAPKPMAQLDTEDSMDQPDTGDSMDQPDTGDSMDQLDTGGSMDQPDTGDSMDQPDTGDSMDQPDTGDSMDQPDTGDSMDQQDTGGSMDQLVEEDKMNEGDPAPAFDLMDVLGNEYQLDDYAGKKVYIKFWASWCSICLAGLEELNTLAGDEQDFIVLTIVSPNYKNEMKTDAFIKWFEGVENVSNIKVLLDEEGTMAQEIGVRGYPTSAFIGSDGILIKTQPGHVKNEDITAEFENIY
jgi:peptide methionine sulfoxide reductase msrA/msrB